MPESYNICLDVGGTKVLGAIFNEKDEIIYRLKKRSKSGGDASADVEKFIIGIVENIIKGLDVILFKAGIISQPLGLATFSDAFSFALLIIILVVKPTGLFGEKVTDKV